MMRTTILLICLLCGGVFAFAQRGPVLHAEQFRPYIDSFNKNDSELYREHISNKDAWNFLKGNIPLFDCPDKIIERTYYFRWWTYRKHIRKTPAGFVITEFLPNVPWAGRYNAISCPAGFHFYEGRWLHDKKYLNDYAKYWFQDGSDPRAYSFWAADAIYNFCLVSNDFTLATTLLPALVKNEEAWDKSNLDANGLYWQVDDRDGMEVSICGQAAGGAGFRPTINSYMYGDAIAVAKLAAIANQPALSEAFASRARTIKHNLQTRLWDDTASFFKVIPKGNDSTWCTARELHGYTPWYFNLPDTVYGKAWKFAMDSTCFYAPYGLTTAQRDHPGFRISYQDHECQWNGPSWPYATSITLTALANFLNNNMQGEDQYISREDYYALLKQYANSQQRISANGKVVPWIDENLNPFTGDWISRTRLSTWANGSWSTEKGGKERGKDYNHSTFCDLVITGLVGLRPQQGNKMIINPLLPDNLWSYFCLDNVAYHGKIISIVYDKTGEHYKKGKGFSVFVNGERKASAPSLRRMEVAL